MEWDVCQAIAQKHTQPVDPSVRHDRRRVGRNHSDERHKCSECRCFPEVGQLQLGTSFSSCEEQENSFTKFVSTYRLTRQVTRNDQFTQLCASLYALLPAPAIGSVPYTEPFYTLCTFLGSWLVITTSTLTAPEPFDVATTRPRRDRLYTAIQKMRKIVIRAIGIACLMLASGTRSLGVLNCAVLVWPVMLRMYEQRFRNSIVGHVQTYNQGFWISQLIFSHRLRFD